jgi:23S rRNA (adenine2503-C2)-methyltransferase
VYYTHWLSGEKEYRKKQLQNALFKEFVNSFDDITVFPKSLREKLESKTPFYSFSVISHKKSSDTEKILIEFLDGKRVETVLMKHSGRNTVCVSSQVGCAANCSFCSTGKLGFTRHLTSREIVEQLLYFSRMLKQKWQQKYPDKKWNILTTEPEFRVRNVVFMGMGEPLFNFEHVSEAIHIFETPECMNMGIRHITVSTVGVAIHIPRFLELPRLPNLAVSLHAATNDLRDEIVPMNKSFPLKKLFSALDDFTKKTSRRIFYEWTVLPGINDTKKQMDALGKLLQHRNAHVNFIPWNPGPSRIQYTSPTLPHIRKIQEYIKQKYGVLSTIRAIYGQDMGGACGQLAANKK